MELHQLRYLVEIANTQSFTRAARLCHVTQPTLSHQVKKLEDEMGEPLFQRNRRGAYLTPLGERLYAHAVSILRTVDMARQEASSFSREVKGRLRLGIIPTVAPYLLPGLLKRCREKYPELGFQISEQPTEELIAAMRQGSLDLSILSPPVAGDFQTQDILEDEFLLALPANHPLTLVKSVELQALRNYPMILMNDAHCLRGQTLSLCDRAGFTPQFFIESAQLDTVMAMVESGLGISLVPAMSRGSFAHRRVLFRSFPKKKVSRLISLTWSKQLSQTQACSAFRELCRQLPEQGGA